MRELTEMEKAKQKYLKLAKKKSKRKKNVIEGGDIIHEEDNEENSEYTETQNSEHDFG